MAGKQRGGTIPREYAKTIYLGLGPTRSLGEVATICARTDHPTSINTLKRWSRDDGWVEEAAKFDGHMAEQAPSRILDAIADEVRHVRLARAAQDLADAAITAKRYDDNGNPKPLDLSGSEIARLLDVGIKNERLVSGKATERLHIMTSDLRMLVESVGPSVAAAFDRVEAAIIERVEEPIRTALLHAILDSKIEFARHFDSLIEAQYTAHGLSLEAGEAIDPDD